MVHVLINFSENNRFSVIRSEYSGEKITTKSIIKSNGSFSMVTNTIAIEHAKGKVISIKNEMDSIDENMTIIKTDVFFFIIYMLYI